MEQISAKEAVNLVKSGYMLFQINKYKSTPEEFAVYKDGKLVKTVQIETVIWEGTTRPNMHKIAKELGLKQDPNYKPYDDTYDGGYGIDLYFGILSGKDAAVIISFNEL